MHNVAYFEADTLDDLLMEAFSRLLENQEMLQASRGNFTEIFGAMLVLRNPRARLSRSESKGKIFSALGELFWYLSKTNGLDFMEYYLPGIYTNESDDGISVRSGYGERLFDHNSQNQIQNIISLLKAKPSSRRAVIQLFDASDLSNNYKSIPCTCTLQFIIRNAKLNMYEKNHVQAKTYIAEGWQSPISMEPMPIGDPWEAIGIARDIEIQARRMQEIDLSSVNLAPYWADICRLLVIFRKSKIAQYQKTDNNPACHEIKNQMSTKTYDMFIDARLDLLNQLEET
jgi:thymidylate synthase